MGVLHLLLLAKLKLLASSHGATAALQGPYVLKLAFSTRDMFKVWRYLIPSPILFFLFQLNQIFSELEPGIHNGGRWERAFQLACERFRRSQWSPLIQSDHASLYAVSMASL